MLVADLLLLTLEFHSFSHLCVCTVLLLSIELVTQKNLVMAQTSNVSQLITNQLTRSNYTH